MKLQSYVVEAWEHFIDGDEWVLPINDFSNKTVAKPMSGTLVSEQSTTQRLKRDANNSDILVGSRSIDSLAQEYGAVPGFDFIKLTIEGSERHVLDSHFTTSPEHVGASEGWLANVKRFLVEWRESSLSSIMSAVRRAGFPGYAIYGEVLILQK